MPAGPAKPTQPDTYSAVPLAGLVAAEPVTFELFLRTADDIWVLYRPAGSPLDESHIGRLQAEGITTLFIRDDARAAYLQRVEGSIDQVLLDRAQPLERRAEVLHGVAARVADDLLAAPPDRAGLQRAQKTMMATSGLLLRESNGFRAIRSVLAASHGLAAHSLTVGFLAMGLARSVLGADANALLLAGLAGLLHDVGRVGHEGIEHDPEHAERGAAWLRALGVQRPVVDAVHAHHERHDGSGFPRALAGDAIPELARIIGLVDTFETVYSEQRSRGGVFDALRIVAQTYGGCFDDRLARGLVRMFR